MFSPKQAEIVESFANDSETVVPAGNMLGKDNVAGFLAVWAFVAHHPVRIVTTSVADDHLRVLWAEINFRLQTARFPMDEDRGGLLRVNHREIRKVFNGILDPISYLLGQVSEKGEKMAGHHAANTFAIIDEASGVDDIVYTQIKTWAQHVLIIGNCNPTNNFFFKAVEGGDVPMVSP